MATGPSLVDVESAIEELKRERDEARAQQAATAEVLRVISQSPTDVQPVLQAVVAAARRFCGAADDAGITLREDSELVVVAHAGSRLDGTIGRRDPIDRSSARGRSIIDGVSVHIPDLLAPEAAEFGRAQDQARELKFRAVLAVPMLRDGGAVGCITLRKPEPGHFTPRQIELLETFAAQAVIAIENVRLFTELSESLDQQTATSEVLRAISQSPTDVQPVLNVVVNAARRFCGASDVVIGLRDGDELAIAAHEGPLGRPPARRRLDRSSTQGRAIIDARTIHNPDFEQLDPTEWAKGIALSREFGFRSALGAPMLRDGVAIGTILLRRPEPGPFTPRQIELLETFAAQAVIAIENVRLFTELRESLEQQTATTEILRAISQSPTDVQPVLDVVVNAARRFCGASDAVIGLRDGAELVVAAHEGPVGERAGARRVGHGDRTVARIRLQGSTGGANAARRHGNRRHHPAQARSRSFHPAPSPASGDIRRPGGDRHRERAAVHRAARIARAADGDGRDPARHLPVTDRCAACSERGGQCGPPVLWGDGCRTRPARRRRPGATRPRRSD
jgi:GAF domain-containing protein